MTEKWRQSLLLLVLALIPTFYDAPLLNVGIDHPEMVRHLDYGELELYEAHGTTYAQGPFYGGYFSHSRTYPKAFYNLAGVFLYPYSVIVGEDFKTVMLVWRGLNMLFGVGALLALFFLLNRVFHSKYAAFLGALSFAVTPEFLQWTANVRPNPLEQMLIFLALFFCVSLYRVFSYRSFLIASLMGALAFATKYGGAIFIVFIPVLSVYVLWRERHNGQLAAVSERHGKLFRSLFPLIALLVVAGFTSFAWALRSHGWDSVSLFVDWTGAALPQEWLPGAISKLRAYQAFVNAIGWGCLVALPVAFVLALAARTQLNALASAAGAEKPVFACAFLFLSFLGQTVLVYATTYFVAAPAYVAHPDLFLAQFAHTIYYTVLGGSYGFGMVLPVGDRLAITGRELGPGWLAFAPLLVYSVFLAVSERSPGTTERKGRIVLYVYCGISLAIFALTRQVSLRHILPVTAILYGLMSDVFIRKLLSWTRETSSHFAAAACAVLLSLGIAASATSSMKQWQGNREKLSDIGFEVGDWLRKTYSRDVRIVSDTGIFYIPPTFRNVMRPNPWGWNVTRVSGVSETEWRARRRDYEREVARDQIARFDPEVLVLAQSEESPPPVDISRLIGSDPVLRGRGYHIVRTFRVGPERAGGRYKFHTILIYEKAGVSRAAGIAGETIGMELRR